MKRRNFFGKLTAVTGAVVAVPQLLITAEKSAREFHEATKAVESIVPEDLLGSMYFNTLDNNLYIALFTENPETIEVFSEGAASPTHVFVSPIKMEVSYEGYSRVPVNRSSENWEVKEGRAINKTPIVFPECTGGWQRITHFGICAEQYTHSEPLMYGPFSSSVMVSQGTTVEIAPGNFEIEA